MARRVQTSATSAMDRLPAKLAGPLVIEDWLSADEIAGHTGDRDCPACPAREIAFIPCDHWLNAEASHRQIAARTKWFRDRGIALRGAVPVDAGYRALISRRPR